MQIDFAYPVNGIKTLPTAIDLFCGAGGLSAALESAGWQTVAAVDHDKNCVDTLKEVQRRGLRINQTERTYFENTRIIGSDIGVIRASDLGPADARNGWRPDLLAGGPPCQPFSSAGR